MQSVQDNSVLLYGQRVARYQAFIEDIDSLKTTCLNHLTSPIVTGKQIGRAHV